MDRFDEDTINVLVLAEREARLMGHISIGTEEIFLGMLAEEAGIVARTFASFGIYLPNGRAAVKNLTGLGDPELVPNSLSYTMSAKRAISLANDFSTEMTKPEHIMLSILDYDGFVACRAIEQLRVERMNVYKRLLSASNGETLPPPADPIVLKDPRTDYEFTAGSSIEALANLSGAHSFIGADFLPEPMRKLLGASKQILGAYLNSEDDCVVLCDDELYWLNSSGQTELAYKSITNVELPTKADDRHLRIARTNPVKTIRLPVLNETEGTDDLYHMFEFLFYRTRKPARKPKSESKTKAAPTTLAITDINSQSDFVKFIKQAGVTNNNLSRLGSWLDRGGLNKAWLKSLRVDAKQTKDGAFWRLFAAMLIRFPEAAEEPMEL